MKECWYSPFGSIWIIVLGLFIFVFNIFTSTVVWYNKVSKKNDLKSDNLDGITSPCLCGEYLHFLYQSSSVWIFLGDLTGGIQHVCPGFPPFGCILAFLIPWPTNFSLQCINSLPYANRLATARKLVASQKILWSVLFINFDKFCKRVPALWE
jgi:hypothetical protein